MANVYIKTDGKNRVTAVNSSVFLKNTEGWTQIDGGRGDRFVHAQGNYFPKPLTDESGVYVYKYENGRAAERSPEEMAEDSPAPIPAPPSAAQIMEILENSCNAMFDGLKLIADRDNPIPLRLPMMVRRNLIYSYGGEKYVCLENGIAREHDMDRFFIPD